jgi:hypothetical protein
MRGKLFFGAATAALLMFAPAASAQQADPAGDASTQARFSGDAVESELAPEGDVDWYRMNVERGLRYAFVLDGVAAEDGATVDPMIAIYDNGGNQLAFNDDANGTLNAALQYTPAQSGEVFVEVRSFLDSGTGRYRLSATSRDVPPDDAGNDATTRARVQAGRAVNGDLEYEGDVDAYRLSARTGQTYHVTLRGADGAETPLSDPLLRVVDGDGNELMANDDDGESLNAALDFTPQANGDVFVEARGFADANAGSYTLSVTAVRAPSDNISAERNTRGRVNVGGSVGGALDFASDADWYRVRLEEGQSYRFTLDSSGDSPLTDPLLRLRNAAGEELAIDDDGGEGFNSYLEFTAPTTGNYFLEANAFSEGSTGGYTLNARAGDIPADSSTDASLSGEGDYREGVLSPAGDRDWYRVNLTEGQGMRVALTASEAGDGLGDPFLALYGADGATIVSDDDGGEGLNAWLEFTAPSAGAYYLEARGFTEDAAGRYAISITSGEIGSSAEGAEYLTAGPEGRVSTLGTAEDSDWFLVEMIEGRTYRFNLDGIEEGALADPVLTLFDQQGNQIAQDDDGGAGFGSYLTFASPIGGSYFAAVSSFDGGTGRYMLRVTDTDIPGHVYSDEALMAAADDRVSRIEMEGDLDYFRVDLEGGVRYQIELNGHGEHQLADPMLTIVDQENTAVTSDDDSGSGRDARLSFTPESTGTYFIQASGLGGTTGWYQVSIVRQ